MVCCSSWVSLPASTGFIIWAGLRSLYRFQTSVPASLRVLLYHYSVYFSSIFVLVHDCFLCYNVGQKGADEMPNTYTEARARANRKYEAKAYDRVSVILPKGKKVEIQAAAGEAGLSVNAWIGQVIEAALQKENAEG